MKLAFIPMSYADFEQRFLSSVICKNGRLPGADEETFVGKHSGSKFIFALYSSEFLMKVDIVPSSGGIMLKYRFKIRPLVWGCFVMFIVVAFLFLLSFYTKKITRYFPDPRFIFLLIAIIAMIISMIRKRSHNKKMLFQKLNEICCGMLPAEEEVDHNG